MPFYKLKNFLLNSNIVFPMLLMHNKSALVKSVVSMYDKRDERMEGSKHMKHSIVDIATVSGSRATMYSVNRQLREYLPEGATLVSYSFEEGIPEKIYARVLLLSGESFERRLKSMDAICAESKIFIAERAINVESIPKLVSIVPDSTVLIVNDTQAAAYDAIASLQKIGFTKWHYIPYSPEIPISSLPKAEIDCTLSIGELECIPDGFEPAYDIGTRIIAIQTIAEIWSWLGWPLTCIETYLNHYLEKVISMSQRLYASATRINDPAQNLLVQKGLYPKYGIEDIYGKSAEMQNTKQRALRLAQTDLNILIEGESGTGKELFASAIHQASERCNKPYLAINFSSLNDSLIESELFGYENGAFTGAKQKGKAGVFEIADGGTIFLDEIGDISPKVQVRLLRVLQEKEVMRIGDEKIRHVDVRIIAATNQNLAEKVRQGMFREDLYYRLKIGYLYLPPLRNRKEDIPYLAQALLQDIAPGITFEPALLELLQIENWPGNVRELKNTIIYMNAMRTGSTLRLQDLPEYEYRTAGIDSAEPSGTNTDTVQSLYPAPKTPIHATMQKADDEAAGMLLALITEMLADGNLLGRQRLLRVAAMRNICHSEYRLRKLLTALETHGLIVMGKGKVGIRLP